MSDDMELVIIPDKAKIGKQNRVYIPKKEFPVSSKMYASRGYYVIGELDEESGKMRPNWNYQRCVAEMSRDGETDEEANLDESDEDRLDREFEGDYFSHTCDLSYEVALKPVMGYLTEKFFGESGMSQILEETLGANRAWWIKLLSGAMAAGAHGALSFECLSSFPMQKHVVFSVNPVFALNLWGSISEQVIREIFSRWIGHNHPGKVVASYIHSRVTFYEDKWSDNVFGWFSSRFRPGTRYSMPLLIYRDKDTGLLLATEREKYDFSENGLGKELPQVYTIKHSDYPELRNAELLFFRNAYTYMHDEAVKQIPTTFTIKPSVFMDQKEMKRRIRELEKLEYTEGRRILRWDGDYNGVGGHYVLLELKERQETAYETAGDTLNRYKKRLQAMSFYDASNTPVSSYYIIEADQDEIGVFGDGPFTVRFVPGATKTLRQEGGRFLIFTTGEPLSDEWIIRNTWADDDKWYVFDIFMSQQESEEVTDIFTQGMRGRDLCLFLAAVLREWIYDHMKEDFGRDMDVDEFAEYASRWRCEVYPDSRIEPGEMDDTLREWLARFGVTKTDILDYLREKISQTDYFSDEF